MGFAGIGGISLTGLAVLLALNYLSGGSVIDVLSQLETAPVNQQEYAGEYAGEDAYETFAATVLGSTNDAWRALLANSDTAYREPRLVLFRGATESACGVADARVGPHYCPLDETIYLDETFFEELTSRFGARGGDVAEAYVIAHEAGHHVQNLSGTLEAVDTPEESIALELQADCFAGLWAHSLRDENIFEPNEITEAMDAASAVGDDRIQARVEGRVTPENWTHGSSAERQAAFTRGYESGALQSCL